MQSRSMIKSGPSSVTSRSERGEGGSKYKEEVLEAKKDMKRSESDTLAFEDGDCDWPTRLDERRAGTRKRFRKDFIDEIKGSGAGNDKREA